jgi:hypothetical protein
MRSGTRFRLPSSSFRLLHQRRSATRGVLTAVCLWCVCNSSLEQEFKGKQSETLHNLHQFPQELIERSMHPLQVLPPYQRTHTDTTDPARACTHTREHCRHSRCLLTRRDTSRLLDHGHASGLVPSHDHAAPARAQGGAPPRQDRGRQYRDRYRAAVRPQALPGPDLGDQRARAQRDRLPRRRRRGRRGRPAHHSLGVTRAHHHLSQQDRPGQGRL